MRFFPIHLFLLEPNDAFSHELSILKGPERTSALLAPIMLLSGHAAEVFTAKFSPDGTVVASGSHDKHLFFWRTYGECENFMMIQGKLIVETCCIRLPMETFPE